MKTWSRAALKEWMQNSLDLVDDWKWEMRENKEKKMKTDYDFEF